MYIASQAKELHFPATFTPVVVAWLSPSQWDLSTSVFGTSRKSFKRGVSTYGPTPSTFSFLPVVWKAESVPGMSASFLRMLEQEERWNLGAFYKNWHSSLNSIYSLIPFFTRCLWKSYCMSSTVRSRESKLSKPHFLSHRNLQLISEGSEGRISFPS